MTINWKNHALAILAACLFAKASEISVRDIHQWYFWFPIGVLGFTAMDLYGKSKFGKKS
jgi:hypothetical protein